MRIETPASRTTDPETSHIAMEKHITGGGIRSRNKIAPDASRSEIIRTRGE